MMPYYFTLPATNDATTYCKYLEEYMQEILRTNNYLLEENRALKNQVSQAEMEKEEVLKLNEEFKKKSTVKVERKVRKYSKRREWL